MSAQVQRTRSDRRVAYEWRCAVCRQQPRGIWFDARAAERSARAHDAAKHGGSIHA